MAILKFKNVGIRAVAACVPKKIEYTTELSDIMSEEDIQKIWGNNFLRVMKQVQG